VPRDRVPFRVAHDNGVRATRVYTPCTRSSVFQCCTRKGVTKTYHTIVRYRNDYEQCYWFVVYRKRTLYDCCNNVRPDLRIVVINVTWVIFYDFQTLKRIQCEQMFCGTRFDWPIRVHDLKSFLFFMFFKSTAYLIGTLMFLDFSVYNAKSNTTEKCNTKNIFIQLKRHIV
jgi:hypothetical protein